MTTIEYCPILRPTQQEFSDFYEFIEMVDRKYSKDYGMVKVKLSQFIVPPKQFKARQADYLKTIDMLVINGPIEQNAYGKGGCYECLHIQKKSMLLKDYRTRCIDQDQLCNGKTVEEVEAMFWKNLAFSPPLYGADIKISLMDNETQWNYNNLNSVLREGLLKKISGVNEPYLYIGSWKTFFAWHKEDLDLYATNYLHYGKPKFWYTISPDNSHVLENYARQTFSEHFSKCSEYLRHKTVLINPYLLKQKFPNLKITKYNSEIIIFLKRTVHSEGEIILVFGGAYHAGFNWGFNIAEAVNYAPLQWLDLFLKAKACRCMSDSVKIDPVQFSQNLLKGRLKSNSQVKLFVQKVQEIAHQNALKLKKQQKMQQIKKKIVKKPKEKPVRKIGVKLRSMRQDLENWIQCSRCRTWRKIKEKQVFEQIKSERRFKCEEYKNLKCPTFK